MKIFSIEITEEVKEILKQGKIEGNLYFLPVIQLDRKQYTDVNQVLELLGGKWNRSKKAHIFESSEKAQSLIEALQSGSVIDKKKTYQFFETPESVVKIMIDLADIKTGMGVLEPSAGHGAILDHLPKDIELHIIEVDEEKCQVLKNVDKSISVSIKAKFDPKKFFVNREGLYVFSSFKSNVSDKSEEVKSGKKQTLQSFDLTKSASDKTIENDLPKDHIFSETDVCAIIASLIEKQSKGQEGMMLNNGYANLFYTTSRVVFVDWHSGGGLWSVLDWHRDGGDWVAGSRVFSPATEA